MVGGREAWLEGGRRGWRAASRLSQITMLMRTVVILHTCGQWVVGVGGRGGAVGVVGIVGTGMISGRSDGDGHLAVKEVLLTTDY